MKRKAKARAKRKVQSQIHVVRKMVAGDRGPAVGHMVQKSELIYEVTMDPDKDFVWNEPWGRNVWFTLPYVVQE